MGPAQDLFGQLWKEYALSDSRYLTSDPFVLCMETVTAVSFGNPNYLIIDVRTDHCLIAVYMGTTMLRCRSLHYHLPPTSSPSLNNRLRWSNLWLDSLLCYQHVRSLLQECHILPTRVPLFLGLLFLHELYLDGFPR